jgi:Zn-dependent protease
MKRSIKLFKIKGITIKMHWSFLIILVWIIATNAVEGFTWHYIKWSLIFIVLIFFSVLVHELVHYWVAKRLGVQTTEINFLPIGGISVCESFPKNKKSEIMISISGPLANLAIAGLLLPFVQNQLPIWDIPSHFDVIHGSDILYKLHLVNLGLFFINLIPAFPLDGGDIFRTILAWKMDYFEATKIVVITGRVIAAGFLITGLIYLNLLLLVIGLLIFSAVQSEEYILHLRSLIKGITFGQVTSYDFTTLQGNSSVKDNMGNVMNNHTREFLIMEAGLPVGSVPRWEIINEASEKHYSVLLKDIMKNDLRSFNADEQVEQGFKTLVAFPYRSYPVLQNKRFTGVTSLMCIMEYLLLNRLEPKEHKMLKSLINKI